MGIFRTSLSGEIDLAREDELDALVARFRVSAYTDAEVVLAQVQFMDSTGLSLLVRLNDIAQARGGSVTLVDPPRICLTVLAATDLTDIFRVRRRADTADDQRVIDLQTRETVADERDRQADLREARLDARHASQDERDRVADEREMIDIRREAATEDALRQRERRCQEREQASYARERAADEQHRLQEQHEVNEQMRTSGWLEGAN